MSPHRVRHCRLETPPDQRTSRSFPDPGSTLPRKGWHLPKLWISGPSRSECLFHRFAHQSAVNGDLPRPKLTSTFHVPAIFEDCACVGFAMSVRTSAEEMTKHERRMTKEARRPNDKNARLRLLALLLFAISHEQIRQSKQNL